MIFLRIIKKCTVTLKPVKGIFPKFIPVLFQVAAAAGLAIPDLVSTAQSSRPCPDKRVIEESRIAHEPPSILGARPNPKCYAFNVMSVMSSSKPSCCALTASLFDV
ncbi:unnamed protein product [Anisakis simplex]|uniref:Secreted protein n=1 Tax=Anisakis simplex TaxID=6269 RepID=A0A0M3KFU0_ANISI|nr:unnamed protein product [Anisakis simplex]